MFYPAVISHRSQKADLFGTFFFKPFDEEARNPCPLSMNPTRSESNAQIPVGFIKNIPHCPLPFSCLRSGLWMGLRRKTKAARVTSLTFLPVRLRVSCPARTQLPQVSTHTHTRTHLLFTYQTGLDSNKKKVLYQLLSVCGQGPVTRLTPCRLSLS